MRCSMSSCFITVTSRMTLDTSHLTPHTSHLTPHTSHVTRHTSHVTRHTSHLTPHTSHLTRHLALCQCIHINATQRRTLQLQCTRVPLCRVLLLTQERIAGQGEVVRRGGLISYLIEEVEGFQDGVLDMGSSRGAETIELALQR